MPRFSEEEVVVLHQLVESEIYDIQDSHIMQHAPEYYPFLANLAEKLKKYFEKHYPEEAEDVWQEDDGVLQGL